jgi:hypothetical protein
MSEILLVATAIGLFEPKTIKEISKELSLDKKQTQEQQYYYLPEHSKELSLDKKQEKFVFVGEDI